MLASKALRLCKGSAVAPSKRTKNLTRPRTRLAKNPAHRLSSQSIAWPSGLLQLSFTPPNIHHTHTTTKWSTLRAYATKPGAQNGEPMEQPGWIEAKSVLDQLKGVSLKAKKKIGDWLEVNEVTIDMLANYADPAKEARVQGLPQAPFIALVRKAKELRASDDVKKAIEVVVQLVGFSESDTSAIVDWMLTNKVALGNLATYADPDEVSRKEGLPRGPFSALVKKVKESRAPKVNPLALLDPNLPQRDDPRFKVLRFESGGSESFLEGMTDKFVPELPDLQAYPKGFMDKTSFGLIKSTLLTPQRIKTLRQFAKAVRLGEAGVLLQEQVPRGMILSGPNGVGKSILSYLLACTAFVNGCILLYIPLAGKFMATNDEGYRRNMFEALKKMNAPILASINCKYASGTLLDLVCETPTVGNYDALVKELQEVTAVPVVFIMDEHNELWKGGFPDSRANLLRDWSTSTRLLTGARLLPILSGSAHSKFEEGLQSSLREWRIHVRPMMWPSVRALLGHGQLKLPAALKGEDFAFYHVNGGAPREMNFCMAFLHTTAPNLEQWRTQRTGELIEEAEKFIAKLTKSQRKRYIDFIQNFFHAAPTMPPGAFFDSGLMYFDTELNRHMPLSQAASDALLHLYGNHNITLAEVLAETNGSVQGVKFEHWVLSTLQSPRSFDPIHLGDSRNKSKLQLPGYNTLVNFTVPLAVTLPYKTPRMFKPIAQNHPVWDLILHDVQNGVHRVVFFQVSTSPFHKHDVADAYPSKAVRSLEPGTDRVRGQVKQLIQGITGLECTTSTDKGVLGVTSAAGNLVVEFVYITTSSRMQNESKTKIPIVGVQVVCLEELQKLESRS